MSIEFSKYLKTYFNTYINNYLITYIIKLERERNQGGRLAGGDFNTCFYTC